MLRGVLTFRGAPDAQRGPVFLVGPFFRPRWSEGLQLPGRAFLVVFRTDFVTFVWVSNAFEGVLTLVGLLPENLKGASLPPPLRTSPRPDTSGMQNNLLRSILPWPGVT